MKSVLILCGDMLGCVCVCVKVLFSVCVLVCSWLGGRDGRSAA